LQSVLGPSGPRRHCGVTAVPQLPQRRERPGFLAGSLMGAARGGGTGKKEEGCEARMAVRKASCGDTCLGQPGSAATCGRTASSTRTRRTTHVCAWASEQPSSCRVRVAWVGPWAPRGLRWGRVRPAEGRRSPLPLPPLRCCRGWAGTAQHPRRPPQVARPEDGAARCAGGAAGQRAARSALAMQRLCRAWLGCARGSQPAARAQAQHRHPGLWRRLHRQSQRVAPWARRPGLLRRSQSCCCCLPRCRTKLRRPHARLRAAAAAAPAAAPACSALTAAGPARPQPPAGAQPGPGASKRSAPATRHAQTRSPSPLARTEPGGPRSPRPPGTAARAPRSTARAAAAARPRQRRGHSPGAAGDAAAAPASARRSGRTLRGA
jgi:hypothetical protein